ncbi:MAG: M23 family metallopeptidase [Candidatus Promineifilaceae bacterium]|nr:M23 family metallopeptidase [Candidatus Promineifilaceae bacterium]
MLRFLRWLLSPGYRLIKIIIIAGILIAAIWLTLQFADLVQDIRDPRSQLMWQWFQSDPSQRDQLVTAQIDACPGAPFVLPADGFIGLLYNDPRGPYSQSHPHQGIDIFSNTDPGTTPVFAAYDGFITRESDWRSSIILRIPQDPLAPQRQIWLYYTHMADQDGNDYISDAIPPGTKDLFVEQGTFLGYTGNYNGNSLRNIWVHLHFSIVHDDGNGRYLSELDITNTIDPSPYLGINVNYACENANTGCTADTSCANT